MDKDKHGKKKRQSSHSEASSVRSRSLSSRSSTSRASRSQSERSQSSRPRKTGVAKKAARRSEETQHAVEAAQKRLERKRGAQRRSELPSATRQGQGVKKSSLRVVHDREEHLQGTRQKTKTPHHSTRHTASSASRPSRSRSQAQHSGESRKAASRIGTSRRASSKKTIFDNPKIRKLLLSLIAGLIALVLVVIGIFSIVSQINSDVAVPEKDPASSFSPVACTPEMVESALDVQPSADVATGERHVVFNLVLRNTSKEHPCYIDLGSQHGDISISSGEDSLVSLASCNPSAKESRLLLLDRGMETSMTYTWNGHRGNGCTLDSPIAQAGSYSAVWESKDVKNFRVVSPFILEDSTPPPAAAESEGVPAQETATTDSTQGAPAQSEGQ